MIPVLVFTLVYNVPKFFELYTERVPVDEAGRELINSTLAEANWTMIVLRPTELRLDEWYIRIYILWMNLIVQIVVPFALLVFLNIKIFQRVKQLEARIARNSFGFAHSLSKEKDDEKASNGGGGCLECGRGFLGEVLINFSDAQEEQSTGLI